MRAYLYVFVYVLVFVVVFGFVFVLVFVVVFGVVFVVVPLSSLFFLSLYVYRHYSLSSTSSRHLAVSSFPLLWNLQSRNNLHQ